MSALNQTDFETLRLALLDTYNSQTTAHAGYVLALAVGIVAILYQLKYDTFFSDNTRFRRLALYYLPLSILVAAIFYVGFRIIFWAWMSSAVLGVTPDQASGITTIYGIHNHLVTTFCKNPGLTSLFYSLDQNRFGSSILVFFLVSFGLMGCFDYWNDYRLKKDKKKWLFLGILAVSALIISIIAVNPTLIH